MIDLQSIVPYLLCHKKWQELLDNVICRSCTLTVPQATELYDQILSEDKKYVIIDQRNNINNIFVMSRHNRDIFIKMLTCNDIHYTYDIKRWILEEILPHKENCALTYFIYRNYTNLVRIKNVGAYSTYEFI